MVLPLDGRKDTHQLQHKQAFSEIDGQPMIMNIIIENSNFQFFMASVAQTVMYYYHANTTSAKHWQIQHVPFLQANY